jgi:hypothetical protein
MAPLQLLTASASADVNSTFAFSLDGLNGSNVPRDLFDFYKIEAIRMTIRPQNNAIGMLDPTTTKLVPLYWVLDYNDATNLGTAAIAATYENCVVLSPGESGARTFQPRMLGAVKSNAGTDYMSVGPQWLTVASDDVPHYGAKVFIPQVNGSQTFLQTWQVSIEYWMTFRNVV